MSVVIVFGALLLAAVLVSEAADRTVLSTAVLFIAGGFVLGSGVIGAIHVRPQDPVVGRLAELALFSILFTDGMRINVGEMRLSWRLPGRVLVLGLPLTLVLTAVVAHLCSDLGWTDCFLLGAVLSPTDPVFAAAIVGRKEIPARVRNLLNVESGVNDGLALPIVVVLLAASGTGRVHWVTLAFDLVGGIALGIVVPLVAAWLTQRRIFAAASRYEPLHAVAVGMLVLSIASVSGLNEFLGAFAAGFVLAQVSPAVADAFEEFGELLAELLKLAALLVFGAMISPAFLSAIPWTGYLFAVIAIVVARPVPVVATLAGSGLRRQEKLAAAWFGPKGFASVVFGLLILDARLARSDELFHLVAIVVSLSIVAHSSSDVPLARWLTNSLRDDRSASAGVAATRAG